MRDLKGSAQWARQTLESDVFLNKPPEWFKIWFCIVQLANFKDTKQFKRGQFFIRGSELQEITRTTPDQIKKFLQYARRSHMIRTERSSRGMLITVLNYDKYQTFTSKSSTELGTSKAPEKHQRSTTIEEECKNEKNVKNTLSKDKEASPRYKPLSDETMSSSDDRDHSFPRKRVYGDERVDWTLDYWEHLSGRRLTGQERWNRIYARHLVNKLGMKQVRELLEWLGQPENWWFDKVSQVSTIYKNADKIFQQMEKKEESGGSIFGKINSI